LKNQTVLVTFSITIVLAFVGKGVKRGALALWAGGKGGGGKKKFENHWAKG